MIISFLLNAILTGLSVLFSLLPVVEELPFGLDAFFVSGVGGYKQLMAFFPPLETVLIAFGVYLGFRIILLIMRVFLGSNSPTVT